MPKLFLMTKNIRHNFHFLALTVGTIHVCDYPVGVYVSGSLGKIADTPESERKFKHSGIRKTLAYVSMSLLSRVLAILRCFFSA